MIALSGRSKAVRLVQPLTRTVWLIADSSCPVQLRHARAVVVESGEPAPEGFGMYLVHGEAPSGVVSVSPAIVLPEPLEYLSAGDVLSISADGSRLRVLWRQASRQNHVLLTERCDHFCLMCSQPPKLREDDWLLEQAFELIRLLPRETPEIGFTGGEPTLYGERLFELLRLCRNLMPAAALHVLSNGRRFADRRFADGWAAIDSPNLMVGIPLYGAESALHDYIVQARGAFNETVRGLLNLGALQQRIEVRVVIHKQTAPWLEEIAEFIARNLCFVEQVALMGLEMTGFARANMEDVWIDPVDYQAQLVGAVDLLTSRGIKTMVYNHQLCLTDQRVWPYTVKSISDWKNEYHSECLRCDLRDRCGGFFMSARHRMSDHIAAVLIERHTPAVLAG
ncbi:MAG TPA: His-Xaa-Ser system radical SAM maturase HxsC [Gaiellaceae bacterium]|jgi:His-Xaa-Ser system radical SAM maturase HxsC|nr:His-Xaa-Ser system radical SAM maturase HxsC [Gaiellaceae bacterium]